jgi:hypothetical protein
MSEGRGRGCWCTGGCLPGVETLGASGISAPVRSRAPDSLCGDRGSKLSESIRPRARRSDGEKEDLKLGCLRPPSPEKGEMMCWKAHQDFQAVYFACCDDTSEV